MLKTKLRESILNGWFLVGGALVIVATRWFLKSHYLFHWDSVQFTLALQDFNAVQHQPHPPGYIIYVYLGKFFNLFFPDPNVAFIALGILASVVGLVLVFALAREAFSRSVAYIAALFYIFNPLVWFHGLVAEVYIVEMALILGFVFLAHRYYRQSGWIDLVGMVAMLGILGGTRQSAEVVMLPLLIWVLWQKRVSLKQWLMVALGLMVVNLAWFIPILWMSGGWREYFLALGTLTEATIVYEYVHDKWNALLNNLSAMIAVLKQAFWAGLLILMGAALPFIAEESRGKYKINIPAFWFWCVAIAPSILIMPVILMRNPGYVLSVTSLLIILAAAAVVFLGQVVGKWHRRLAGPVWVGLAMVVLTMQVGNFFTLKFSSLYYLSASLDSVQTVDEYASDIMQSLQKEFDPATSAIWIPGDYVFFGVRHFQYYLPEFEIYSFAPQSFVGASSDLPIWHVQGTDTNEFIESIPLGPEIRYLIAARDTYQTQDHQIVMETAGGHTLIYYDLDDPATVDFFAKDKRFAIAPRTLDVGGDGE